MSSRNKGDFAWLEDFRREHLKKSSRNPGLAALMSFFMMGLGQMYAGHIDRGIILLFFHLFSLLGSYSLFSGGMFYKWLMSFASPHIIVIVGYVFTVVFILTWIYNIKDAYYLAIFSSFRDWFEVERVLLPSMGVPSELLISNNNPVNLLENKTNIISPEDGLPEEIIESKQNTSRGKDNDDTVINVTAIKSEDDKTKSVKDENNSEESLNDNLIYMNSNTWKIYWVSVLVVIGIGLGIGYYFQRNQSQASFQIVKNFEAYSVNNKKVDYGNQLNVPQNNQNPIFQNNVQTNNQQGMNSNVQPVVQPNYQQNTQSNIQPVVQPNYQQNTQSNVQPVVQPNYQQSAQPMVQPNANVQQVIQPNAQPTNITQEQIEAYVDNRIKTLLEMNNKFNSLVREYERTNEAAALSNNKANTPLIVSSDVASNRENNFENNYSQPDSVDRNNHVIIIQGNKDATIMNKTSNEEIQAKNTGVVLYEAKEEPKDDVELVITNEGDMETTEKFSLNPVMNDSVPIEVERQVVVPNVNQQTIDRLKAEEKAQKEEALRGETNEKAADDEDSEPKGKVLFERNDEIAVEKPKVVENKKETQTEKASAKNEKRVGPRVNFESEELRAKLEKIKEKGASEFYQGNWEAALPFYFEILKYRRNAESFEMVGIIFEKMNKLPDAFEAYENAYTLGMDSSHSVARLGLIAEKIGNYEKAQKYLEKAIEKNPKRVDIILSYARCLNKQGESTAAAQVLAVLRDSTNSYAIKKAAEQEYQKLVKQNSLNNTNSVEESNSSEALTERVE